MKTDTTVETYIDEVECDGELYGVSVVISVQYATSAATWTEPAEEDIDIKGFTVVQVDGPDGPVDPPVGLGDSVWQRIASGDCDGDLYRTLHREYAII